MLRKNSKLIKRLIIIELETILCRLSHLMIISNTKLAQ